MENFLEAAPIIAPEKELEIVRQLDATVTLADINALAKEIITNKNQVVTLFGPEKDSFTMPSKSTIEKTILKAQTERYAPYVEKELSDRLIDTLPTPGSIVS